MPRTQAGPLVPTWPPQGAWQVSPSPLGGRPLCGVESSSTAQEEPFCAGGVSSPDSFLASARTQLHLHCTWVIIQHLIAVFAPARPASAAGSSHSAPASLTRPVFVRFCIFLAFPPLRGWKMPQGGSRGPRPSRGIGHSSGRLAPLLQNERSWEPRPGRHVLLPSGPSWPTEQDVRVPALHTRTLDTPVCRRAPRSSAPSPHRRPAASLIHGRSPLGRL